jgi:hypothetical protein
LAGAISSEEIASKESHDIPEEHRNIRDPSLIPRPYQPPRTRLYKFGKQPETIGFFGVEAEVRRKTFRTNAGLYTTPSELLLAGRCQMPLVEDREVVISP